MEIMTGYTDEQVRDLAQRPTPIMPGTWVLTSPDGKTWREDTPLKCVWAEQNDRIPPEVALARIKLAIPNGPDHPDGHDSDGFVGGCERMGCPGGDDCTSRTPLDLFALSASELSKIIIESRGEAYACQVVNELEAAL